MGWFEATYRVERKDLFGGWHTVLKNVNLKEADAYVEQNSGFFSKYSPSDFRVVKE